MSKLLLKYNTFGCNIKQQKMTYRRNTNLTIILNNNKCNYNKLSIIHIVLKSFKLKNKENFEFICLKRGEKSSI